MLPDQQAEFIELFCGIGGFSAAVGKHLKLHVSIDVNLNALEVFRMNFSHPCLCKTIDSLKARDTIEWSDKSWWLSPPCQPFTRRGRQDDLEDPRNRPFLNVLNLIAIHCPPELAMENVPEFLGCRSHRLLVRTLKRMRYHFREFILCPTQFGYTHRRRRYYLIAARRPLGSQSPIDKLRRTGIRIDRHAGKELILDPRIADQYATAMDFVLDRTSDKTACFTSAYGRSHVRSGSYLSTPTGVRRFSPREILWSLGFGDEFRLPDWPNRKLWPLVGNSLAIAVVRYVVSQLPSVPPLEVETGSTTVPFND